MQIVSKCPLCQTSCRLPFSRRMIRRSDKYETNPTFPRIQRASIAQVARTRRSNAAKRCRRVEHFPGNAQGLATRQRHRGKGAAPERLQALNESHGLSDEALHAWCREKGLYAHQLQAWRDAFCAPTEPVTRQSQAALRELQSRHDLLERQLLRKDKALAEAAALLVLQKKFQALWADEV